MGFSLKAVWHQLKPHIPGLFTKGRFNFITIHYLYISGMALVGSVPVFAIGGMPYIDALFFSSGGATQSGLNTIDLNKIRTSQQFLLYLLSMLCNPIIIHSSLVFVRLYWFEKRFKHVVQEARNLRSSKSRSKYVSKMKDDPELGRKEEGVRGRSIVVLRNDHTIEGSLEEEKMEINPISDNESSSSARKESDSDSYETGQGEVALERRGAIGTGDADLEPTRSDQHLKVDHHIAFLENQRSPKDKSTLRIPSPREFDRGGKPQDVGDEETAALTRKPTDRPGGPMFGTLDFGRTPQTANRITIDEPDISRSHERISAFPKVEKTDSRSSSAQPAPTLFSRAKSRRGSNSNLKDVIRANTNFLRSREETPREEAPYLSYVPTIVRNSTFVNLNEQQREELGGIEYRALKTLAIILMGYYFAFHIFGVVCFLPWIMKTPTYGSIVTSVGQGRPWWAIFTAGSAFNDLGFTLTPDSMISFNSAYYLLLIMAFLIIIGNTGFPCMLRFIIWLTSKLVPRGTGLWEELQFLLDHPRRCFTLLFPKAATWWLFAILIILNGVDLILYVILDLNEEAVTRLPGGLKFVNGLFQAASTRTAGFAVVNISTLHPGVQVSYMIMMYISVLPIAISMRRTNVYEEKSLGIYGEVSNDPHGDGAEPSYIGAHLRKQLSFDLWYVFLGLFLIAIIEGDRIENTNDYAFTMFSVLFEIISAYGTVGLSLGYPTINASFSGEFRTLSKLVIIAMQIRGRHRGLPYELDRAVLLPSESLQTKEAAEAKKMLERRGTSHSASSRHDLSTTRSAPQAQPVPLSPILLHHHANTSPVLGREDTREKISKMADADADADAGDAGLNDHSTGHLRAGLGSAMFRLASPLHKTYKEGEEKKQDKWD